MDWLLKDVAKGVVKSISVEFLLNRAVTRSEQRNYQGVIED
ncbi:hypothetical protein [Nostoc sp.]